MLRMWTIRRLLTLGYFSYVCLSLPGHYSRTIVASLFNLPSHPLSQSRGNGDLPMLDGKFIVRSVQTETYAHRAIVVKPRWDSQPLSRHSQEVEIVTFRLPKSSDFLLLYHIQTRKPFVPLFTSISCSTVGLRKWRFFFHGIFIAKWNVIAHVKCNLVLRINIITQ